MIFLRGGGGWGLGNFFLQEFLIVTKSFNLFEFYFTSLQCISLLCVSMQYFYFFCKSCAGIFFAFVQPDPLKVKWSFPDSFRFPKYTTVCAICGRLAHKSNSDYFRKHDFGRAKNPKNRTREKHHRNRKWKAKDFWESLCDVPPITQLAEWWACLDSNILSCVALSLLFLSSLRWCQPKKNMASQIVLISGCSSGIGLATAVLLAKDAEKRFKVYATMRNLAKKGQLEEEGKEYLGDTLIIKQMDVCSDESVNKAVQEVLDAEGKVDVLCKF